MDIYLRLNDLFQLGLLIIHYIYFCALKKIAARSITKQSQSIFTVRMRVYLPIMRNFFFYSQDRNNLFFALKRSEYRTQNKNKTKQKDGYEKKEINKYLHY